MTSNITLDEVFETSRMIRYQKLDIRAVTVGLNLKDCFHGPEPEILDRVRAKILRTATDLIHKAEEVETRFGVPIVNKRIAVTPAAILVEGRPKTFALDLARGLDSAAGEAGIDFIGGFGAMVEKGFTPADILVLESLPEVMATTQRLCGFANLAATRNGLNLDGITLMGRILKSVAQNTEAGIGCAKIVCFANAPQDNPFMAGAFHGVGEGESALNVGVSGPGVVLAAVREAPTADLTELSQKIRRTSFKLTRAGEVIGRELAQRIKVPFGIVDLSLAPSPAVGDSVGRILEAFGLEATGAPGSTMAVAMLVDAIKKGGLMASGHVGGLSGTFLPVTEDEGLAEAAAKGALTIEKLEAMTSVCSVGLDMIAVPGDTPAETLAGIMADELVIGVINHKTTATRIIPVPGKKAGDTVDWGGLLGSGPIMAVSPYSPAGLIRRGGRMPAPVTSLKN